MWYFNAKSPNLELLFYNWYMNKLTYYQRHRDERLAYQRAYQREKGCAVRLARRKTDPIERARKRREDIHRRARKHGAIGSWCLQQWFDLCDLYAPDGRCLCCGQVSDLTADHVVPLSIGGSNWIANIQPLCCLCNQRKTCRSIDFRPDRGLAAQQLMDNAKSPAV